MTLIVCFIVVFVFFFFKQKTAYEMRISDWSSDVCSSDLRAAFARLRQPWPVWLTGIGGLFGYHALYFTALSHAPAVEASLICYLWPLLLVLFSALLPGERLRWWHLAGADRKSTRLNSSH